MQFLIFCRSAETFLFLSFILAISPLDKIACINLYKRQFSICKKQWRSPSPYSPPQEALSLREPFCHARNVLTLWDGKRKRLAIEVTDFHQRFSSLQLPAFWELQLPGNGATYRPILCSCLWLLALRQQLQKHAITYDCCNSIDSQLLTLQQQSPVGCYQQQQRSLHQLPFVLFCLRLVGKRFRQSGQPSHAIFWRSGNRFFSQATKTPPFRQSIFFFLLTAYAVNNGSHNERAMNIWTMQQKRWWKPPHRIL